MIHQLIFAHPKPGMSEEEFHTYWVHEHAPRYASKIPQIKRYAVDTRVPFGPESADPLFSGIAEIWLENEQEQLASLQSPEFIEGARADEPNWAAFWRTIALDTDAHVLRADPVPAGGVKLVVLVKRAPGLRRYLQCHNRDGAYAIGEALLDAAYLLSFDSLEALQQAYRTPEFKAVKHHLGEFADHRYIHRMAVRENWIIGSADYLTGKETAR
jgi:uncharacterized protein (TIGR02118 family)